jgi:hypothetical protein
MAMAIADYIAYETLADGLARNTSLQRLSLDKWMLARLENTRA